MSKIISILFAVLLLIPSFAWAEPKEVSSTDLIEKAKETDLQEVVFTGEVIGDIMTRGINTWINVSDGANAIGIYMPTAGLKSISIPGRYDRHGDEVRITGIFNRACAEHGGDMDIHADSVQLIAKGYPTPHGIEPWKVIALAVLILFNITLILYILQSKRRHSTRNG